MEGSTWLDYSVPNKVAAGHIGGYVPFLSLCGYLPYARPLSPWHPLPEKSLKEGSRDCASSQSLSAYRGRGVFGGQQLRARSSGTFQDVKVDFGRLPGRFGTGCPNRQIPSKCTKTALENGHVTLLVSTHPKRSKTGVF